MKKKKYRGFIFIIIAICIGCLIFILHLYGVFHSIQPWSEEKFIGKSIDDLNSYLSAKKIILEGVNNQTNCEIFERLSGKKISKNQEELYRFWGGKKHQFLSFPIGTKTYGLYVLVKNGKIIFIQETVCVDSL